MRARRVNVIAVGGHDSSHAVSAKLARRFGTGSGPLRVGAPISLGAPPERP
jgi:hypothetical protein